MQTTDESGGGGGGDGGAAGGGESHDTGAAVDASASAEGGGSGGTGSGGEEGDGGGGNQGGGKQRSDRRTGRGGRRYAPYGGGRGGNRAVYQQETDSDRSCRVYVGNLSWDVTWKELKDHMKTTGCEVTRADVLCSPDGRSKGCGIVEFETAEGAQRAVLTLNDTELMGRQIFVREDREEGSGGGYYAQQTGAGGGGGRDAQSRRVYVGNLSWDVAWQDLKDHMRQAGEVVFAEVMTEPDGRSKGCGIAEFATAAEAEEAISTLTDTELKGRMIFVREDRETGGGGGGGVFGGYRGGGAAGTSVYVGNLAYETSWQDLKDHMRKAGNVDQANILQGDDGRSKGCGIVRYQRPQDASRAIRELQNTNLNGRPIFVREDREQGGGGGYHGGGRGGGGGGGGGYRGGGGEPGCQLWVGNLSYDTTWRELKDHFRQCGDVERAEVMETPDGQSRGFGTVRFYKRKDADFAVDRLDGEELQGRKLEVKHDSKA